MIFYLALAYFALCLLAIGIFLSSLVTTEIMWRWHQRKRKPAVWIREWKL